MTVKEFLLAMKWWIPIELVCTEEEGNPNTFWYKRYKHNERDSVINEYGDRKIHYWRAETNYKKPDGHIGKNHPIKIVLELYPKKEG